MTATMTATRTDGNTPGARPKPVAMRRLQRDGLVRDDDFAERTRAGPGQHPHDDEVASQVSASPQQRRDHHEADGPQRPEPVQGAERGLEAVGERVEQVEDRPFAAGHVTVVQGGDDKEADAEHQADPVAGAPPEVPFRCRTEQPAPPTGRRGRRRRGRGRIAGVHHVHTLPGATSTDDAGRRDPGLPAHEWRTVRGPNHRQKGPQCRVSNPSRTKISATSTRR